MTQINRKTTTFVTRLRSCSLRFYRISRIELPFGAGRRFDDEAKLSLFDSGICAWNLEKLTNAQLRRDTADNYPRALRTWRLERQYV